MAVRLLTVPEVAEMTRTSPNTLRFWRASGGGLGPPSFKIGRRVMYLESDCLAWIEAQYAAGTGTPAA